jgi:hypothetical protein
MDQGSRYPRTAAPDTVGAFRFICNPSHNAQDDPIVNPGKSGGASHLHTFWGNPTADANSTFASLRAGGESTCQGGPLNRSAYWLPALMTPDGRVVMPDYISIYYKAIPGTASIPTGLRTVFGADPNTMRSQVPVAVNGALQGKNQYYWDCHGPTANGATSRFPTIMSVYDAGCRPGRSGGDPTRLQAVIAAPECWDGVSLDSTDHRDHMAYRFYDSVGAHVCPDTHPVAIPSLTLRINYKIIDGFQDWVLSSDAMPGMSRMPGGTTLHADYMEAWDRGILDTWHKHCIDGLLNCSGSSLVTVAPAFSQSISSGRVRKASILFLRLKLLTG